MLFKILRSILIISISSIICFTISEGIIRLKNSNQKNYIVETWRYNKELTKKAHNKKLSHIHIPNSKAKIQNVDFVINSYGLRGPKISKNISKTVKTVLLLGSSITMGWGIDENKTLRAQLQKKLGNNYRILNGGIANYNTSRYVELFKELSKKKIKIDIVIIHYFINDAEFLKPFSENVVFRNSQLAFLIYFRIKNLLGSSNKHKDIDKYYENIYNTNSKGYLETIKSFKELKTIAKTKNLKVIFTMMPDVQKLKDYPFKFIHKKMKNVAENMKWPFLDLYDKLSLFKDKDLKIIDGDPHPNAFVHRVMAEELSEFVLKLGY